MSSALVILDVQNDLVDDKTEALVPIISVLAKEIIDKQPVIFATRWLHPTRQGRCVAGTPGSWTPQEMFLSPEMIFVRKATGPEGDEESAFCGAITAAFSARVKSKESTDDLAARLKRLGVEEIMVCGLSLASVSATIRDAEASGFRAQLIAGAVPGA